jgi:hypothetical protein
MVKYRRSDNDFYREYINVRIIVDNPTIAQSMRGTVTGVEPELEVLEYVEVTVTNNGKEYTTETTEKGNYQFKILPEGKCSVSFAKNYYQTLRVKSEVHQGKVTELDVKLAKIENKKAEIKRENNN